MTPELPGTPAADARRAGSPVVLAAIEHLEAHLEQAPTLAELAAAVGRSPAHLQRTFREQTGLSPREYVSLRRLGHFKRVVRKSCDVLDATWAAGFGSSRALYETAKVGLGMTPGRYARRGRGLRICASIANTSLGPVLVAATPEGICAVYLGAPPTGRDGDGDAAQPLRAELAREFSEAELSSEAVRADWLGAVVRHIEDTRLPLGVPLDARGTAFQLRVWEALRAIPVGERRSYAELATELGNPRSFRAVARACATNSIAVLVPCHRVVRKDGNLAGYRWGLAHKRRLLEREQESRST